MEQVAATEAWHELCDAVASSNVAQLELMRIRLTKEPWCLEGLDHIVKDAFALESLDISGNWVVKESTHHHSHRSSRNSISVGGQTLHRGSSMRTRKLTAPAAVSNSANPSKLGPNSSHTAKRAVRRWLRITLA